MTRSILSFVCFLLFVSSTIMAQVAAGVTGNLTPNNNTPAETVNIVPLILPGQFFPEAQDSLDLNRDGQYDVLFHCSSCNDIDCIGGSTQAGSIHENMEFMTDPDHFIRQLDTGDIIDANQTWEKVDFTPLIHRVYGIGGYTQLGNWFPEPEGYAGVRLFSGQDTLYGWIKIKAFANPNGGAYVQVFQWAIQHDPSQIPYAAVTKTPEKPVYCKGDYVVFEANVVGAEEFAWHFWDGSTDSSTTAIRILPDSTVNVTFEATNQNGTTTLTQTLQVSPLLLTAPDITLDCAHPSGILTAETNIPAEICWIAGADTTCNPTPPTVNSPVPVTVVAQDQYGCIATEQIEILVDANVPDVAIEYDEVNHWLIAHSSASGVVFTWYSVDWPVTDDTVTISQSGTYTLVATAPNGCTASTSITVVITTTDEPFAGSIDIQPNPASDVLRIENRLPAEVTLKIFNAAGSVQATNGTALAGSGVQLDIASLPEGLYFLVARNVDGKILFLKKFVKQ